MKPMNLNWIKWKHTGTCLQHTLLSYFYYSTLYFIFPLQHTLLSYFHYYSLLHPDWEGFSRGLNPPLELRPTINVLGPDLRPGLADTSANFTLRTATTKITANTLFQHTNSERAGQLPLRDLVKGGYIFQKVYLCHYWPFAKSRVQGLSRFMQNLKIHTYFYMLMIWNHSKTCII